MKDIGGERGRERERERESLEGRGQKKERECGEVVTTHKLNSLLY